MCTISDTRFLYAQRHDFTHYQIPIILDVPLPVEYKPAEAPRSLTVQHHLGTISPSEEAKKDPSLSLWIIGRAELGIAPPLEPTSLLSFDVANRL